MCDISVEKLAIIFEFLDPMPPVTSELVPSTKRRKNQKGHMYWWFLSQNTTGKGAYSRIRGNNSSESTYNRLQTAKGMLWIAEALGEDETALRQAFTAAEAEDNARAACAAFREVIPWERISALIHDPSGWRIDPAAADMLYRVKGWPVVRPAMAKEYKAIIEKELA